MSDHQSSSIVVCGSGIAGLATALGLSRAGFAVSLVGQRRPAPVNPGESWHPRVYALSPSSKAFLESLGVWAMLDTTRVTPVEAMDIFGDADGRVSLNAWHNAMHALAWIVESGELERVLQQAIQVYGTAWYDENFQHLHTHEIITSSGRRVAFDLLIGADGAQSDVRRVAGIAHHSRPYGDRGVVTHLTASIPHQNRAMQWFLGDSILALLPLPDTSAGPQVSMVWSMPEARAQTLAAMPEASQHQLLQTQLQAVTGGCLGDLVVRSKVLGFPLTLDKSGMIASHVALVGDAAHRVHPLAGQGLNLGLGDVAVLIQVLSRRESWRRVGDVRVLERYRRQRAEPIEAMRLATHGLYKLFAAPGAPAAWLRNIGMHGVDYLPWAKRLLIQGAR